MKLARKSFGASYECKHSWPEDCFVQCGDRGIVLKTGSLQNVLEASDPIAELVKSKARVTSFFEAFPMRPSTFIRGEGENIEAAEQKAWDKFQKYLACTDHEFERRGYKNGAGFCKKCGMFKSKAFAALTFCIICEIPTDYTVDKAGKFYCESHKNEIPEEQKFDFQK